MMVITTISSMRLKPDFSFPDNIDLPSRVLPPARYRSKNANIRSTAPAKALLDFLSGANERNLTAGSLKNFFFTGRNRGIYFFLKFKEITFDRLLGQITVSTGVKPFPSKTKVISKTEVEDVFVRFLDPNLSAANFPFNPYARYNRWETSVRMVGGGEVEIHTNSKESVVSHLRDRIEAFVRDRPADLS